MNYRWIAILLLLISYPAFSYTTHINAPAVITNTYKGALTQMYLNVTPGNGSVEIGPKGIIIGNDTLRSIYTAVSYGTSYLKLNESRYNFNFTIDSPNSNVSGPSAGLAFTLLVVTALQNIQLNPGFTVTGTITPNGTVGEVGGVFDKIQAAKAANLSFILVPYAPNSTLEYNIYYLAQQTYGIPVVEVSNVSQALRYSFGNLRPKFLEYNITTNYKPELVKNAGICSACNNSAFAGLVNMTINITSHEINLINGTRFGSVKLQLSDQLSQFKQLASKGYLYTAADLAFIEYPTAFMFVNYKNSNYSDALSEMQNISEYCGQLNVSPQLTSANYEYLIGGRMRHTWALITLSQSYSELNSSQSSDDVFSALTSVAPSYAWCAATSYLYNVSSAIGGSPITLSQKIGAEAVSQYSSAKGKFGPGGLYIQAANYSIGSGDYATALYSIAYAKVFYSNIKTLAYNSTSVNYTSQLVSNSLNQSGVWPVQFGLQSYFYLNEASINRNNIPQASGYLNNAYTTATLSVSLAKLNSELGMNFVNYSNSTQSLGSVTQISETLNLIIYVLVVILVLLVLIILVLIVHITGNRKRGR